MDYQRTFDAANKGRGDFVLQLTSNVSLGMKIRKDINREASRRRWDMWHRGEANHVNFSSDGCEGVLQKIDTKGGSPHRSQRCTYTTEDYLKPVTGEQEIINACQLSEMITAAGLNLKPYGDGMVSIGDNVLICAAKHEFTDKVGVVVSERRDQLLVKFPKGVCCYFHKMELRKAK